MDKVNQLVQWAKERRAVIPESVLFVEVAPGNFGAEASKTDSIRLSVPIETIVKLSDAAAAFKLSKTQVRTPRNINAFAKLYLAHQRAPYNLENSPFREYIASLPSAAAINSPYVWLPEDLALLAGTNLGNSIRENVAALVEEWWLVLSVLPEAVPKSQKHYLNMKFYYEYKFYEAQQLHEYVLDDLDDNWTSFPAYLWALMIYKSRSFPSKLLAACSSVDALNFVQDDVAILIPVVDLLNHSPRAQVTWSVAEGHFVFEATGHAGGQLFNNYGRKGNEELLLAYGFCLADNSADTVALKIKVPVELLPQLELHGIVLPKISDYTDSVVNEGKISEEVGKLSLLPYDEYKDGLLFFLGRDTIPEALVGVFQWLVKTRWEDKLTLRMRLSGLNHLRQALESKALLLDASKVAGSRNSEATSVYLAGQKRILRAAVTLLKRREKELLSEHKSRVLSLKSVYKKDAKFARSFLVTHGVACYDNIITQELTDQMWLMYLIRCYNKDQYAEDAETRLPLWIYECFVRMNRETDITAHDVVQFRELYENLVIPMKQAVPEMYNVGKWTVRELVVSAKLLDTIGFVRGKSQECFLVDDFTKSADLI